MPGMLRVALVITVLALATRSAVAADCNEYDPTPVSASIPLGCPLVVFVHPDEVMSFPANLVRVLPGGMRVDAAASVDVSHQAIDVELEMCDARDVTIDYATFSASGYTANVGDWLVLGTARPVLVTDPGTCPAASAPVFYCACAHDPYDDQCNAGRGGGGTLAIVLAIWFATRRSYVSRSQRSS
jgi:hypothetical protein